MVSSCVRRAASRISQALRHVEAVSSSATSNIFHRLQEISELYHQLMHHILLPIHTLDARMQVFEVPKLRKLSFLRQQLVMGPAAAIQYTCFIRAENVDAIGS